MQNMFKVARTVHNQHGPQSTKEVEKETGVTKSLIEDIESTAGKPRNVGYLTVKKLAEYYGVSSDYLLGLSNTPSTKEDIQAACKTTGLTETAINKVKNFQDKAALSAVLESQKLFDLIKAIADSAKYADNRGYLIGKHMTQVISGQKATVPPEDMDYTFLGKTIDATVKLFREVSARLYDEKEGGE